LVTQQKIKRLKSLKKVQIRLILVGILQMMINMAMETGAIENTPKMLLKEQDTKGLMLLQEYCVIAKNNMVRLIRMKRQLNSMQNMHMMTIIKN